MTRRSGILLHPTSLPGPDNWGTLGSEARSFVDYLSSAGQTIWQILPLGPTGYGDCPYSSFSAFAGNPDLISLQELTIVGDLLKTELPYQQAETDRIDFEQGRLCRAPLLKKASRRFFHCKGERRSRFEQFCEEQASWLNDYAFYRAMRNALGHKPWFLWPEEIRTRQEDALCRFGSELSEEILHEKYLQFTFFEHWGALKNYANQQGVFLFGDLPIFVAHDSADVWANQHLFQLDAQGQPTHVAGVPPDYFSETGQLWGNPLYNWERMRSDNYAWWQARIRWNLRQCDLVRIDHFRGFESCWAVPVEEKTAINGSWQPGPGADFFHRLGDVLGKLPLIAEDLGVITPSVEKLRDDLALPGMKILQFAFDSGPKNPYLPHHHVRNSVVYTGTHDNTTSLAWWQALDGQGKQRVRDYLDSTCRDMPWPLIRCALSSCAQLAVLPMQDLLKLGGMARMNRPGTASGNWNWRMLSPQLDPDIALRLRKMVYEFDRLPSTPDTAES